MLQKLYIKNYAIIDELTIEFDAHLNVITGETGAGKSIILGALSLILGERADTSVLINTNEKCVVEAHFDTKNNVTFNKVLQAEDLDVENTTIVRREISTSGKSRAFVNDTPVTLTVLNKLTSVLVDLHRQFDNRALDESRFMYETVDAMAGNTTLLKQYQQEFLQLKQLQQQHTELSNNLATWQKEADYNQFLFDELEQANFQENEIETAEDSLKQLSHAEQIKSTLALAFGTLTDGELPINTELKKILQQLQQIENVYQNVVPLNSRLNSVYEELKDIAVEIDNLQSSMDIDAEALQTLEERVDLGNKLFKKHGVHTTNDLRAIHFDLSQKLLAQNNADAALEGLEKQIDQATKVVEKSAAELYKKRLEHAPGFDQDINKLLELVGMPNAILKIEVNAQNTLNAYGKDQVLFLLDANKSGKFATVQKAASGGELSRIMLSIKTLTAKALALPTLIFDEVDTGISGEAARQVGILLRQLGQYHQVLCITHQPQVAGKGNRHFYVYKTLENETINTRVKTLAHEERVQLIAQMIGGEQPSAAAINNAKELVAD